MAKEKEEGEEGESGSGRGAVGHRMGGLDQRKVEEDTVQVVLA